MVRAHDLSGEAAVTFTARTRYDRLKLYVPLTFVPATAAPSGPPPAVPVGAVVPVALRVEGGDLNAKGFGSTTLVIEAATPFAITARLPDGTGLLLTPRRPTEPGSFWRQGFGMSEWVVREELGMLPSI